MHAIVRAFGGKGQEDNGRKIQSEFSRNEPLVSGITLPALLLLAKLYRLRYRFTKYVSMEAAMKSVTISPKYQVVIPREVRQSMEIKPGSKVQVLLYENRIELIPMKSLRRMRGFLKGIKTTVERERDRV